MKKKTKSKPKKKAPAKKKAKKTLKSKIKGPSPKKTAKKKAKKTAKTAPKPSVIAPLNSVRLGYVEDYFAKIGVIALTLEKPVSIGDKIQVLGHTTNFEQTVVSMQIEHLPVTNAGPKDGIGIKVGARARKGDHVYHLLK